MIKNLVRKEILWLGPEAESLLGDDILKSRGKFHGHDFSLKSDRLAEVVELLIRAHEITRIVETGTFNGKGTTLTYAKTGLPVSTCEAHKRRYEAATTNLGSFGNVELNHSFTTKARDISAEYRGNVGEENLPSREDWLIEALSETEDDESILVSLDSGGDVGFRETAVLTEWIDRLEKPKTVALVLDDIRFVKHKKTIPILKQNYGVDVFQVEDRWGFTVLHLG